MKKFSSKKALAGLLATVMLISVSPNAMATEQNEDIFATREEAISEFVQSIGRNNMPGNEKTLIGYTDIEDISPEYKDDIVRAIANGIVWGYEDDSIRPKNVITRAEAMVILGKTVLGTEASAPIQEPIEFTDVPEWAKEYVDMLSAAGIVEGYGDGKLGSDDLLTDEQVKLLTDRTDLLFNTTPIGESFYGYINNKAFRNAPIESVNYFDAKHGAIISTEESWSAIGDIGQKISKEEDDFLAKLMAGEIEYEDGSAEQRVHDMLLCIAESSEFTADDIALYDELKNKIVLAKTVDELIAVSTEIYNDTGVNPLFDISVGIDPETNHIIPSFSFADCGYGGMINYKASTRKNLTAPYKALIKDYMDAMGLDYDTSDISKAVELQKKMVGDKSYMQVFLSGIQFQIMFGMISEEEAEKIIESLLKEHPEIDPETIELKEEISKLYSTDEVNEAVASVNPSDILKQVGFKNYANLWVDDVVAQDSKILTDTNLDALKINALLNLGIKLNIASSEEKEAFNKLLSIQMWIMFDIEDVAAFEEEMSGEYSEEIDEVLETDEEETVLTPENLSMLQSLLPYDLGEIYYNNFYDKNITEDVRKMTQDILEAYREGFKNNDWMSEETKANAIKKIDNISIVIAMSDSDKPVILSPEDGGTAFTNSVRIKRMELLEMISCCAEPEYIRNTLLSPTDVVNAFYAPNFNSINILAGILNTPVYDKNASYATNLGGIGVVIAHEIGHAFDDTGSQYDETGRVIDWWSDEDKAEYQKRIDNFIEYYKNFEVVDGVVQDSELTIGENMADFAGMTAVMRVLEGDREAQKEALEAYAGIWARLGTEKAVTNSAYLNDVHAQNNVRVDAVVASLDEFYEIYGITEEDPMYVAPENRLKLW